MTYRELVQRLRDLQQECRALRESRDELERIQARRLYRFSHHVGRLLSFLARRPTTPARSTVAPAGPSETGGVADFWGQQVWRYRAPEAKPFSWLHHPMVLAYKNRRVSGNPDQEWFAWVKRKFSPEGLARGLSLGCGLGVVERKAIGSGLCRRVDAFDISPEAVRGAIALAGEGGHQGIHYFVADLNQFALLPESYDIAFATMSLHHVSKLEHLLSEVARALKPGGLFVVDEYVGPSRFQFGERQLSYINALLTAFPRRLRQGPAGTEKGLFHGLASEDVAAKDPSEAIRSEEILPTLERDFETLAKADYGGTLLQFLLSDIVGNFDPEREDDRTVMELLLLFEETLNEEGVLPSDFAVIVARKR